LYATKGCQVTDAEHVTIWMRPERPARGPKPTYSRTQIARAAVRIADAEGLDAATMRRVAAEIGTGAMSLYRYVPGRDDLVELMADELMGEIDVEGIPSGDWRADLTRFAEGLRAMWLRHPWIATANAARPSFGPNQLHVIERVLGVLDPYVPADENLALTGLLNIYVEGVARGEAGWLEEVRRSGLSETQWTARHAAYLRHVAESGRYPVFGRLVAGTRRPPLGADEQFRDGLERVLDCIAAALGRNAE
jgi:AcrR family transcriptional regulator